MRGFGGAPVAEQWASLPLGLQDTLLVVPWAAWMRALLAALLPHPAACCRVLMASLAPTGMWGVWAEAKLGGH